jgi:hypothetical protein
MVSASADTPTAQAHYRKAIHNQAWAEHLISIAHPQPEIGKAYDWVATKAYYSAVHYLDGFLLLKNPNVNYQGQPRRLSSVEEFKDVFNASIGMHSVRKLIIKSIASQLRNDWNFLWDTADTARYKLQEVSLDMAKEALSILPKIRKAFLIQETTA